MWGAVPSTGQHHCGGSARQWMAAAFLAEQFVMLQRVSSFNRVAKLPFGLFRGML